MTNKEQLENLVEVVKDENLKAWERKCFTDMEEMMYNSRQAREEMLAENERLRGALIKISKMKRTGAIHVNANTMRNIAKQALGESK